MEFSVNVKTYYKSSLERAFKTPMLCDVTKVHTGFGIMPRVAHCTDDEQWGQPGSTKKVFVEKSLMHQGGFGSVDRVVSRIENTYWKIEVSDFQAWMLGFYKFVGEWRTTPAEQGRILVDYTYTLYARNPILYPLNWLFAKLFWKRYMNQVLENIRRMIDAQEPYCYP